MPARKFSATAFETRRLARFACAALMLGAATGCSSAKSMLGAPSLDDIPESPSVAEAPYPSLADAPEPVAPIGERTGANALPERQRGKEVHEQMSRAAARLGADAKKLDRAKPSDRVILTQDQRAAKALKKEEAAIKAVDANEADKLRAEIEAELNAAFGKNKAAAQ